MNISKRNQLIGTALFQLGSLISRTVNIDVKGLEHLAGIRAENRPLIASAWHGYTMYMFIFLRHRLKHERFLVMIPDDWRGETLHQWLRKADQIPVPMDLQNKGMDTARRFAKLVRTIKRERSATIINPDGPGGPSHEPKPGIFFMAAKVGAPILPIGAYTRHKYVVNRWDAYEVPFPFSRLSLVIGEPLFVPRRYEYQEMKEKLTVALHQATMEAKAEYYADLATYHD
jgi:lysophospholipid acyltransferase (LPLAT)-like uncharacterized protein